MCTVNHLQTQIWLVTEVSVLTFSDYELHQAKVGGLLTLRHFDLDCSKHEDIQMDGLWHPSW